MSSEINKIEKEVTELREELRTIRFGLANKDVKKKRDIKRKIASLLTKLSLVDSNNSNMRDDK